MTAGSEVQLEGKSGAKIILKSKQNPGKIKVPRSLVTRHTFEPDVL